MIFYELVTGKLPFDAAQPMEYIQKHIKEPPIPIQTRSPNREFPHGLWEVIAKALAKKPQDRFQSAAELAQALRDVASPGRSPSVTSGESAAMSPPYGQHPQSGYPPASGYPQQQGYPSPQAQGYPSPQQGYPPQQQYANAQPQFSNQQPQPAQQAQYAQPQYSNQPNSGQPPGWQSGPAQHARPVDDPVHLPMAGPSRAAWVVLALGTVLALLGTTALVLAYFLR